MSTIGREDVGGGVTILTLDRPPANAIDENLLADLAAALDDLSCDDAARALVLRGRGDIFCAGFDFAAPRREDEVAFELYALYRAAHLKLLSIAKPTIAMLNGHTIAGGVVLALACDFRFAVDRDFRFGLNEVAVGASYPRAALEIVRLRLTHAQATELMLGAELYAARSAAVRLGIAHELLPAADLEAAVLDRARRLAAYPRDSYAHTKRTLLHDALAHIEAETDAQALATMSVWISEESRAARRRQREKLGVHTAPPAR